jgi:hypothetical protein
MRTKKQLLAAERSRRWSEANHKRNLANHRRYRDENREKLRAQARALYAKDPERHSEYCRKWRKKRTPERRARDYQKLLAWRKANKDKIKASKARYYQKHRAEIIARSKQWRDDNLEYFKKRRADEYRKHKRTYRDERLRRVFGISTSDYNRMLKEQRGGCAICGRRTPGGKGKHFHVDHCHRTKAVRGLLCHGCNTGIGALGDDPARLRKAADYIEG